jgi:hypothetical protein
MEATEYSLLMVLSYLILESSSFEEAGYKSLPPTSSCIYPFETSLTPPQNKTSQGQVEDVW